jgi:hypothetical protein
LGKIKVMQWDYSLTQSSNSEFARKLLLTGSPVFVVDANE